MPELTIQQAFEIALQHHQAGRLAEAEPIYRQILAVEPNQPETLHLLGVLAHQVGQHSAAIELIRQALAIRPAWPDALSNLGVALHDVGRFDEAIAVCQQAIDLKPDYGKAYNNLGRALKGKGFLDEAVVAYQQAIVRMPELAEAYNNLGNVLVDKGQMAQAIVAYQRALALKPNYNEVYSNLGNVLKDSGKHDEAIVVDRQAIALNPANSEFKSNLLLTLHYHPKLDGASIAAEHQWWAQQHAEPLRHLIQAHSNDRSLARRLRIGYVSPDFRNHSVGYFLLPLLEHHDREQYELFAYAQVTAPDALTAQLRTHTDVWRSTVGLSDAQVAELIRADQIDILVDLAMHTANNRLLVFARKPAPVQVNYLAYVGSSGLATMDYRLSDSFLDPPDGDDSIYCEQTVRLPGTYWCYRPIKLAELPVGERMHGPIRFGCLSNFCKLNAPLVEVWAKILQAVPDAQLMLHAYEGDHRQQLLDRFTEQGIAAERVEIVGRMSHGDYFKTYQSIDITLDTTPYGGGTTTCDSLWMGVPVVTLAGARAVGRGGVSILSNVGLPELIAQTPEEYIQIAVALAHDRPRLQELRRTLRERMQASPLMDAPKYARQIEDAYRQMWRTWCEQR